MAIPVHGEARHMQENARLAQLAGVPVQLTGRNGDLFDIVNNRIVRAAAPVGRLWFDEERGRLLPIESA